MQRLLILIELFLINGSMLLFSQQNTYLVSTNDTVFACNSEHVVLNGFHLFNYDSAVTTAVTGSLIAEDHTSEGFMVTLSSGAIVQFFRIDPGYFGNHIGNNARIVKRTSYNNGLNWSAIEEVFNDTACDDRNVHGGLVGQDSIILFFRRYNAGTSTQIDLNYMYSIDGGQTWSPRTVINSISNGTPGSNHVIKVPGRGWLMSIAGNYYVEIRISQDGLTWNNNVAYIWNYTFSQTHFISEACFTYVGSGKLIGLFRNNFTVAGSTYYQVTSNDNGYSWSEPDSTNIAMPYWCVSPQIFYDAPRKDVWVIATDRRNYSGTFAAENSLVWIYKNSVNEVFNNPMGFTIFKSFQRPFPNWYRFYGYSCYVRKPNGNYLIMFTESFKKLNFYEDADFYQFEINYLPVQHQSINFTWNTGDTLQFLTVDTSGTYVVTSSDGAGHNFTDSVFVSIINNVLPDAPVIVNQGEGITLSPDSGYISSDYSYLWSTGDISSSVYVHPNSTEIFHLTIFNSFFDCTDSVTVTVMPVITGIDQNNIGSMVVYPNPFNNYTEILFPYSGNKSFNLTLFDMLGKILRKEEGIKTGNYILQRGDLAPGIYQICLSDGIELYSAKILVGY